MPSWPARRFVSPASAFSMWRRAPHARGGIHKPERASKSQPARQCDSTQVRPAKMPSIRRLRRGLAGRSLHLHQRNPRRGSKHPLEREDLYYGSDESTLQANSGKIVQAITSPKGNLIFGPWQDTEYYLSVGQGFHSNDLRGTLTNVDARSEEH